MKLNPHLLNIGLLSLGLSTFPSAWSDDATPAPKPDLKIFEQLDHDHDGKLVADEIPEDKKRFFEQMVREADANEDGVIDKDEFLAPPKEKPSVKLPPGKRPGPDGKQPRDFAEKFDRADKNGDGILTRDEIPEKLAPLLTPIFDKIGKDQISREELEKLMARKKGDPEQPGDKKMMPPKGARQNIDRLFEMADADGDGKIYLKDVNDRGRVLLERAYDRLDKDPEDPITLEELKDALPPRPNGPPGPDGPNPEGRRMRRPPGGPDGNEGDMPDDPDRGPPRHPPKFVMLLDKDEDGLISKEELEQLPALFQELDEDEDGQLSHHELLGPPPPRPDGEMGEDEDMPRPPKREKRPLKRPPPKDSSPDEEKPEN